MMNPKSDSVIWHSSFFRQSLNFGRQRQANDRRGQGQRAGIIQGREGDGKGGGPDS